MTGYFTLPLVPQRHFDTKSTSVKPNILTSNCHPFSNRRNKLIPDAINSDIKKTKKFENTKVAPNRSYDMIPACLGCMASKTTNCGDNWLYSADMSGVTTPVTRLACRCSIFVRFHDYRFSIISVLSCKALVD